MIGLTGASAVRSPPFSSVCCHSALSSTGLPVLQARYDCGGRGGRRGEGAGPWQRPGGRRGIVRGRGRDGRGRRGDHAGGAAPADAHGQPRAVRPGRPAARGGLSRRPNQDRSARLSRAENAHETAKMPLQEEPALERQRQRQHPHPQQAAGPRPKDCQRDSTRPKASLRNAQFLLQFTNPPPPRPPGTPRPAAGAGAPCTTRSHPRRSASGSAPAASPSPSQTRPASPGCET